MTSSIFCAFVSRAWRHKDKWGRANARVTAPTNQRTTLNDLQSVWSGSKDLLVDWRGVADDSSFASSEGDCDL